MLWNEAENREVTLQEIRQRQSELESEYVQHLASQPDPTSAKYNEWRERGKKLRDWQMHLHAIAVAYEQD